MGRKPNFYNINLAQELSHGLTVVPGYKSSAFKFQMSAAVLLDNTNKFMPQ